MARVLRLLAVSVIRARFFLVSTQPHNMTDKEPCAAATAQTNEDEDVANLEQEVTEGNWTRPEVSYIS